jgi:hypothetical protein
MAFARHSPANGIRPAFAPFARHLPTLGEYHSPLQDQKDCYNRQKKRLLKETDFFIYFQV